MTTLSHSYLLAEALRNIEEEAGEPHLAPEVDKQAIASGITFVERIHSRAVIIASQQGIDTAIEKTTSRLRFIAVLFATLCFIIGIGATRVLPEGFPARANVVSLLAVLLLPNLISLLLWLIVSVNGLFWRGLDTTNGWLGRRALGIYTFLEDLLNAGRYERAAGRAWRDFLTKTRIGRHRLTIVSHSFWISALLGALLGCWWLLVVRQVDFVWGSTLLTVANVQSLLGDLTNWVGSFGFTVPTADDIVASRIDTQLYDEVLRRRWGIFILGSIMTLGLLPRLVAIVLDAAGYIYFRRDLKLELAQPGYARLQPLLMPVTYAHTIIDPDNDSQQVTNTPTGITTLSTNIPQAAAWLALEHPPEKSLQENEISIDLGVVASYEEQQRVLDQLSASTPEWQAVCVYADLAITPDMGIARLLSKLVDVSTQSLHLVLGKSARAATMSAMDFQVRREDWLLVAARAGLIIDNIHQLE